MRGAKAVELLGMCHLLCLVCQVAHHHPAKNSRKFQGLLLACQVYQVFLHLFLHLFDQSFLRLTPQSPSKKTKSRTLTFILHFLIFQSLELSLPKFV